MTRKVHVIGAGLAGLAAAVRFSEQGERVVVHEATSQAGGRCRSFYDHAIGMTIDNGNHLLLSGNHAAQRFLRTIGAEDRLVGPEHADFPFFDLATKEKWTLRIGDGVLPAWIFDRARRVPGTNAADYLSVAPLLWASPGKTVDDVISCKGALFDRLIQPLLVAALNVGAKEGSAALAGRIIRETLLRGGRACRPLVARDGLTAAFIDPAVEFLSNRGTELRFEHQLHGFRIGAGAIEALRFGETEETLDASDIVVLAVPFWIAGSLLPDLPAPDETRAIVNAHFRIMPKAGTPPVMGLVNATTEWIFAFPDRLSVTISNADRLVGLPRERLAQDIWGEVAAATGIAESLPPWQIVRERRATFAATPRQDAMRPGPKTAWNNLFLAGDWTATGLPATIEGAIRSGYRAADSVPTRP